MNKIAMEVNLGRLKLKNPVMPASGTFDLDEKISLPYDTRELGAIITKSIALKRNSGNPPPRISESSAGLINAIGVPSEGIDWFVQNKLPIFKKANTPIIASIAGFSIKEFILLAEKIDKLKEVAALELDFACPHSTHSYGTICKDKTLTEKTISQIKEVYSKPLIAKLSAGVTDITQIAQAAQRGGADILSLINTVSAIAIDIHTKKPVLGNKVGGLSGPAIKPIALKAVWDVAQSVDIPIIGIGGISNSADAIEFLLAGASAVQVGTAAMVNPLVMIEIIQGIEQYLREQGYSSVKEIIGLAWGD